MYTIDAFKKTIYILNNKQKRNFVFLIFIMILAGLLETLSISLFIPLVYVLIDDTTFANNSLIKSICLSFNINSQNQFVVISFFAIGVMYIFKSLYLYFQTCVQNNYVFNNRSRFFVYTYSIYLNKQYDYFINNSSGDITRSIFYDVINTFKIVTSYINIFTECVICLIILIFLLFINFSISIFVGVVFLFELLIITKIIKPTLINIGKINVSDSGKFFSNIIQSIESIKEIKVFNTEKYFINKNKEYAYSVSKTDKISTTLSTVPRLLIESLTFSSVAFLMVYYAYTGVDIKLLLPSISAFAVAAIRLLPSINKISFNLNIISYYNSSLNNIYNLIKSDGSKVLRITDSESNQSVNNALMGFEREVRFSDVSFKYNADGKYIFENVNFNIPINKCVGIVGESGAGKTTLVDLMAGLIEPNSGAILCDDINISANLSGWLSLIGYVPQNTTLINDSVRANVAFGVEDKFIDENLVLESLREAQIDEFVLNLKDGLDTSIGERGVKLSGGQRQRIGIARALYKKPKILIFDEATSALDNDTEKEVMKSINSLKNKNTIVIIAHRLTTIENCDIIYKVDKGKIYVER